MQISPFQMDPNEAKTAFCGLEVLHNCTITVPYPEFFWAYRYMYRDRDFNESIGEHTVKQTDRQKLWLYLATFRCQRTKQSYKIIRQEEWTVIKLIKV